MKCKIFSSKQKGISNLQHEVDHWLETYHNITTIRFIKQSECVYGEFHHVTISVWYEDSKSK